MKKPKIKKRSLIINLSIVLSVSGLTTYYLIKNKAFDNISYLKEIAFYNFLLLGIILLVLVLCDSFIIYYSFKMLNRKFSYGEAIGAYLFGNLGSAITPARSGHYPFMLFYYEKLHINATEALGVSTRNQLVYSLTLIMVYLIVMIISIANNFVLTIEKISIPLWLFSFIGLLANILYSLIFLFLSYVKGFSEWIFKIAASILYKTKRIESKEEYRQQQREKMALTRNYLNLTFKKIYTIIPQILVYFIFVLALYSFPYVIYLLLTKSSFSFLDFILFFSLAQGMSYASNIIPIPGNALVSEYVFLLFFQTFYLNDGLAYLAVMLWRFFTYYLLLICDLIYFFIHMLLEGKKAFKE